MTGTTILLHGLDEGLLALLLQVNVDRGAGDEDVVLLAMHDPFYFLETPIEEPVGAVIIATIDNLGGV